MRPQTFGAELRRRRLDAGVSIEDLMAETKVSRRVLEAIESGAFNALPERVFSRNFVRQYARVVGAEEGPVLEWFDAAWESFQLASGSHPRLLAADPPPQSPIRWRFWVPMGIAGLIVVAAGIAVGRRSEPSLEIRPDPRRSVAAPVASVIELTPTAVDASFSRPATDPATPIQLTVSAADARECWVHLRNRDGQVEEWLLTAGSRIEVTLHGPAMLTLGNAPAAVVRVGDRVFKDLGRPGQVLRLEVTADGLTPLGGAPKLDEASGRQRGEG